MPYQKDNRFEEGVKKIQEMKRDNKKGRVTFFLDGSGNTSEIEIVEKK